jgi:uncharacterized protein YbbK (DUF523 family)/8-oxo-dGTP pyrophosphatase MutT (NUDIX family)
MGKIIVSACLAGINCRHDGRNKADPRIVELVRSGVAIPLCPEQLGGLPTPRPEAQIASYDPLRVVDEYGVDVTENFLRGAQEVLKVAELVGADQAILKERSPSCGVHFVWRRNEDGDPVLQQGMGVTARLLAQRGLRLSSEEDLPSAPQRRQVVTAFLLRKDNGPRVLILRRSGRVGTYQGRWAGVSGYLEPGVQPLQQALQEIEEEVGLHASQAKLVGQGQPLPVDDSEHLWLIHPFVFEVPPDFEPRLDWEHTEVRWIRPDEFDSYETVPGLRDAFMEAWKAAERQPDANN